MDNWVGICDQLSAIKQPTLVITGASDTITPTQNDSYIAERIPGAILVEISEGGHGVMYQFPDTFSKNVLDFLAGK